MIRSLIAMALVALLTAGCSATPASTGAGDTTRDKAVAFAECMRGNGVSAFPNPDPSGELTVDGVLNGSSLAPSGSAWKEAVRACRDLQPAGFTGRERTTVEQEKALEFAQCTRDNGVEDFPDRALGPACLHVENA